MTHHLKEQMQIAAETVQGLKQKLAEKQVFCAVCWNLWFTHSAPSQILSAVTITSVMAQKEIDDVSAFRIQRKQTETELQELREALAAEKEARAKDVHDVHLSW